MMWIKVGGGWLEASRDPAVVIMYEALVARCSWSQYIEGLEQRLSFAWRQPYTSYEDSLDREMLSKREDSMIRR
jgi:hypothetical protein